MNVNIDTVLTANTSPYGHCNLAIFLYGIFSIEMACCITHLEREVAKYIISQTLFLLFPLDNKASNEVDINLIDHLIAGFYKHRGPIDCVTFVKKCIQ